MGTLAQHFLFLLVAEFLSLYALFWSCTTPGQLLTASLLFPKDGTTAQICGLSWCTDLGQQGFLYVLSHSCCCHQECEQEACHKLVVCVSPMECWECPMASWKIPRGLWVGFLMESLDTFSRIHVPLILFWESCSPLSSLFPLPTPKSCSSQFSALDGARQEWASLTVSHTPRETGCSCMRSSFPYGRNHRPRSFLVLSCAALWEGDVSSQTVLLALCSASRLVLFFFSIVLELLCLKLELPQRLFHLWVIV